MNARPHTENPDKCICVCTPGQPCILGCGCEQFCNPTKVDVATVNDPAMPQDYDEMAVLADLVFGDHPELQTLGDIKAAWARKREEAKT